MQKFDFQAVEQKLCYTFQNKELLQQAFVHSSLANNENLPDNDRMEFLGDAVLGLVVAECIYDVFPNCDSGKLSKIRAVVVSQKALRPVVENLGLLKFLLVGNEEVRRSSKLAANLYEAILCAIYLDGGMEAAKAFVLRTLDATIIQAPSKLKQDSITVVQEYCQSEKKPFCYKEESRSGPDHSPTFTYSLWIDGEQVGIGSGSSKQNAKKAAAAKFSEISEKT